MDYISVFFMVMFLFLNSLYIMKQITETLWNSNTHDSTTKITLEETGFLYIAKNDVCIKLDPEEVDKLLQFILNKKKW